MERGNIEKIIFGILIALGIAYAYYTFVFMKQMGEINRLTVQVEQKDKKKANLIDIKNNFSAKKKEVERMEQELKKIAKKVPETDDTRQFCIDLYYYTKAHNLKTPSDIAPKERQVNKNSGHEKQIINISVIGKDKDVIGLINYLKSLPREVNISSCSIKILNSNEWSADFQLDIFFISKSKK